MKQRHAELLALSILVMLFLVAIALWATMAHAAQRSAKATSPTPSHFSINYINLAGVELVDVHNPWENITDPSVREMLGLGKQRQPAMDAILWDALARLDIDRLHRP